MAVKIDGVEPPSRAEKAGVRAGDILLAINGHEITDVLDYRFFETERNVRLNLCRSGKEYSAEIVKPQYAQLGLCFDTYLMDQQRSCRNKCIFCFIDQLPPGMRETLYFKDDDDRLSFLFGNYITLTNIDDREIDRVLKMHISPINISVHTMDPDGPALESTLHKLFDLGESLLSVACVPVGLTRYREGLYPLTPYNRETAGEVLDLIERFGEQFRKARGSRTVFASDELYLMAERPIPPLEFYEDFPQIENGVGMLRNLQDEFDWALEELRLPEQPRKVTIPTGEAGYAFLDSMLDGLRAKCHNLTIDLVPVHNDFFGGTVDVTGLLTGVDIVGVLKGRELGDAVLLASNMMKSGEDIFLDDMTLEELRRELGVPSFRVENTGEALAGAIAGNYVSDAPRHNPYEGAGQ